MNHRPSWPLFAAIGVLLLVALPWYREPGSTPQIWWGLPDWLAIAAMCFVGVAGLNAVAWWSADWDDSWRDDEPDEPGPHD